MPLKDHFVRVRARTRPEMVGDEIAAHGFPIDIADRLGIRLDQAECLPRDGHLRETIQSFLWNVYEPWSKNPDTDILMMLILWRLIRRDFGHDVRSVYQETPQNLDEGRSRRFAELCAREDGVDFTTTIGKTVEFLDGLGEKFGSGLDMAQVLWRHKLVEPERLMDASQLIATAKATSIYGGSWSSGEEQMIRKDVRSPGFWMAVDPAAAIRGLTPALACASDEDLAWLARGIYIHASRSLAVSGFSASPPPVHEVTKFAFDAVDRRVGDNPRTVHPNLRHTWLHLWREMWWKHKVERDPARDARLLAAADLEIGTLRPIIERGDQSAFTERLPVFDVAVTCVFSLGPLWKGLRSLLLAFRKLPVPGVAADLRWWSDSFHRQPTLPEPWHRIAAEFVESLHFYARKEQETDAELSGLRTEFARFCLDRLKTSESGEGPREDNPFWRMGYIEAVLSLRINPERKGHHTLHHVAEHDPEREVRTAAREAYDVLRHGPKLKPGESPRRCVLLAFWHLRQAHLAALDIRIDERGANRIREEEVRRTTEQEELEHKTAQTPAISPPSGPETGPSLT